MLTENTVSALLAASITGAGLVLAVYALIIPLSRRFFSYRAEEIHEEIQELKERIRETNTHISADELEELRKITMAEFKFQQRSESWFLSESIPRLDSFE